MARKATTPEQAQAKARRHVKDAHAAAVIIGRIIDGTSGYADDEIADVLHEQALILEKAGCYVRRANTSGLIVPR